MKYFKVLLPIIIIFLSCALFLYITFTKEDLQPNIILMDASYNQKFDNIKLLLQNQDIGSYFVEDYQSLIGWFKRFNIEDTINSLRSINNNDDLSYIEQVGSSLKLVGTFIVDFLQAPLVILLYVFKLLIFDTLYFIYQLILIVINSIFILFGKNVGVLR